jgi:LuxR family transcriptional regulator, maltose regulon positive regulatory protein
VHVVADFYLAHAYAGCGDRETAFALLGAALAEATAHDRPVMLFLLGARIMLQWHSGELAAVAAGAEQLLNLTDPAELHPSWAGLEMVELWRGWAYYFLGAIAYERNELAAAVQHWQVVEAMRYRVNPGAYQASVIGLALVAQAQGAAAQALAYAKAARDWAVELRSPPFLSHATALELRLALTGSDQVGASRSCQEIDTGSNQSRTVWLEQPRYTVVRVHLASATPAALATARELAATWLREAGDSHVPRQVIALLALQALLLQAVREPAAALAALARALALGEPHGFVRSFLDLGAPMAELLRQFERRQGPSVYARQLLAAFAGEPDATTNQAMTAQYMQLHGIPPLTRRELELLALLEQRLSAGEMAARLVISPNTINKHINSIYGKLGVNNRRQALARARELGLLPQPASGLA